MIRTTLLVISVFILSTGATPGHAEVLTAHESGPRQSIATFPLGPPTGSVSVEYERLIGDTRLSAGLFGWMEFSDVEDRWFHAKLLYHPTGSTLEGLALGLTAGYHRAYRTNQSEDYSDGAPTLGTMVQYTWLLGRNNRWVAGIGLGIKTALGSVDEDSPLEAIAGDGRFVMGWAL